jgi:Fe-S cluster assembly protein SufD
MDVIAHYQNLEVNLPGQSLLWLQHARAEALRRFSAQGFPSPRAEEWKYTNVTPIEKKLFTPQVSGNDGAVDAAWLQAHRLDDAYCVVLLNGRFSIALSMLDGLPESVTVTSLAEALHSRPDQVRGHFGKALAAEDHGFIHFNTAWFSDGLFLHVPAKQVLDKPVQLLHVVTQPDALATTRNIVVLEAQAQAALLETYIGGSENAYLTAAVSEVFIGDNAQLHSYKMQSEAEKAFHFGGMYVQQSRFARLQQHSFSFGGLLARNEVHSDLDDAAECYLNGLYLGTKRQHTDNHTRINHRKPHGISREFYKGILDQRARGVFQGRVIVHEQAQKTDSEMNNRNLLLSADAEVDTKPQLEIYADDVKCAHGVTVGQLDEKSVFYLQSRCIDLAAARNMLTFAFANEMVDKVENENLKALLLRQLWAFFPTMAEN